MSTEAQLQALIERGKACDEAKDQALALMGFRRIDEQLPCAGAEVFVSGRCVPLDTGFPRAVYRPENRPYIWDSIEHRGTHSVTHWRAVDQVTGVGRSPQASAPRRTVSI